MFQAPSKRGAVSQARPQAQKLGKGKSSLSMRSIPMKKPNAVMIPEKPTKTGGRKLSQKQKDDRKRASQGYRDRQKVLNEGNKVICEKLEARFDTFSQVIFEVCQGEKAVQIASKLDEEAAKTSEFTIKRSKTNLANNKRAFTERLREFLGIKDLSI